jgi:HSP20 family molecular chaperone IbpA
LLIYKFPQIMVNSVLEVFEMTEDDEIRPYKRKGFPALWDETYPDLFRRLTELNDFLTQEFFDWNDCPDKKYKHAIASWKTEDKNYIGTIELPGMKKEEIKVQARDNGLEILAEQYEKKEEKGKFSESSRKYSSYRSLPEDSDLNNIDAKYENGLLTITVPRLEKKDKPKGLEIKVN